MQGREGGISCSCPAASKRGSAQVSALVLSGNIDRWSRKQRGRQDRSELVSGLADILPRLLSGFILRLLCFPSEEGRSTAEDEDGEGHSRG